MAASVRRTVAPEGHCTGAGSTSGSMRAGGGTTGAGAATITGGANVLGAAIAVTKVLPSLKGNFDGISIRVPVVVGSIVDITFMQMDDFTDQPYRGKYQDQPAHVVEAIKERVDASR